MKFMTTTNFIAFANAQVFTYDCIRWKELPYRMVSLFLCEGRLEGNSIVTIVWKKKNEIFNTASC